ILDADLTGAFDHIDHNQLLERLGSFPARRAIRAWLKAGVMDQGQFSPTWEGTPQGGVISPVLLNVALHGMEQAAEPATATAVVFEAKRWRELLFWLGMRMTMWRCATAASRLRRS